MVEIGDRFLQSSNVEVPLQIVLQAVKSASELSDLMMTNQRREFLPSFLFYGFNNLIESSSREKAEITAKALDKTQDALRTTIGAYFAAVVKRSFYPTSSSRGRKLEADTCKVLVCASVPVAFELGWSVN